MKATEQFLNSKHASKSFPVWEQTYATLDFKEKNCLFGLSPPSPLQYMNWRHWMKLQGFRQSKWSFHHTDQVTLWNSLPRDLSNDTSIHGFKGKKNKLMEEKSFEGYSLTAEVRCGPGWVLGITLFVILQVGILPGTHLRPLLGRSILVWPSTATQMFL